MDGQALGAEICSGLRLLGIIIFLCGLVAGSSIVALIWWFLSR